MLKKRKMMIVLLFVLMLLIVLGLVLNHKQELKATEQKPSVRTVEEIQSIVHDNFSNVQQTMEKLKQRYYTEWNGGEVGWQETPEEHIENFSKKYNITKHTLTTYLTDEVVDELVTEYMQAYFCECDLFYVLNERDATTRFEVMQQSEKRFTVRSLFLYDYYYEDPGTYTFNFVKEDEAWKLAHAEFVSATEVPLNIRFEDVEDYIDFKTNERVESEFIEEIEVSGKKYIVIKRDDWVDVLSVEDSKIEYNLGKKYNNLE